jgi:hypothetical protein
MPYTLELPCCDRIDASGHQKKVIVRFEWMDPPGLLWKISDHIAVDNRLKVSIWTYTKTQKNSTSFYAGICRWIYKHVTRVRFVKNECGIHKMELFERKNGEDVPIQHHYLHCIDVQERGLVILRLDKIRETSWQWHECLFWNFIEEKDRTFTGALKFLPHAKYATGPAALVVQQPMPAISRRSDKSRSSDPASKLKKVTFAIDTPSD